MPRPIDASMAIASIIFREDATSLVPRDREANARFRGLLAMAASRDAAIRKRCLQWWAEDVMAFYLCVVFGWNPKGQGAKKDKSLPFIPMDEERAIMMPDGRQHICKPRQGELIRTISHRIKNGGDTLIVDKSREQGYSVISVNNGLHAIRFMPGAEILYLSLTAKKVDGDKDSLFSKADYTIRTSRKLYPWLWPEKLWRERGSTAKGSNRPTGSIKNLETGAVMQAAASTGDAGVAGRSTAAFFDEAAVVDQKYHGRVSEIFNGLTSNAGFVCVGSTVRKVGGDFYNMATNKIFDHVSLWWWDNPDHCEGIYDCGGQCKMPSHRRAGAGLHSIWWDDQFKGRNEDVVKQARDIDGVYETAGSNVFITSICRSAQQFCWKHTMPFIEGYDLKFVEGHAPDWNAEDWRQWGRLRVTAVKSRASPLRVFSPPKPGHFYILAADLSNGGGDNTVAYVYDATDGRIVAEYCDSDYSFRSKVWITALAVWYERESKMKTRIPIGIECQTYGAALAAEIETSLGGNVVSHRMQRSRSSVTSPGITMGIHKCALIARFMQPQINAIDPSHGIPGYELPYFVCPFPEFYDECATFEQVRRKSSGGGEYDTMKAAGDAKDDRVMAGLLCLITIWTHAGYFRYVREDPSGRLYMFNKHAKKNEPVDDELA